MSAEGASAAAEMVFEVVDEARARLQRVFIAFLLALVGSIFAMRIYVWDFLKETTESRMQSITAEQVDIIVRTPFDVILLQIKIGLAIGIIVVVPMLIYYGRGALHRRGLLPPLPLTRGKRLGLIATSLALGLGGVIYAYVFFFPIMFVFLAENAIMSGVKPDYDIVFWTEFLVLLTASFAIAAQLPLLMTVSSYTEFVSYEYFRDKWKYAIVGIFIFGAIFSPPDPFTQLLWGFPLVALYFFSLALAKLAANLGRAEAAHDPAVQAGVRRKALLAVVAGVAGTVVGFVAARVDVLAWIDSTIVPSLPSVVRPAGPLTTETYLPAEGILGEALLALEVGVAVLLVVLLLYAVQVLRRPIPPSQYAMIAGDPEDLDLRPLDAEGIRAAPIEAFAAMDEDEAVSIASQAINDGDTAKAELVLQRFDEGQAYAEEHAEAEQDETDEEGYSALQRSATSLVDGFTEGETTEEDIGGYWYDIVFIYESLTSRIFRVVMVFLGVTFGVFYWLYSGGIGQLRRDFLSRVPADVLDPNDTSLTVALHPVEVLLFNVKVSLLIAIVVTLPVLLYYAWPALRERGFVSGDRRVFLFWGGLILGGLAVGSWLGYSYIAPTIISGLVIHALDAGMVISYRLKSFAWLIVLTTIGIGLLFNLLVSMVLFHLTGIIPYQTMRKRWRGIVTWTLIIGAVATPGSILTMLIVVIPTLITFGIGLAILWLITFPSRVGRGGARRVPSG
ncbi:MAG: twin-arginine translocase subunit TatC [Halobacteriota archaeon]